LNIAGGIFLLVYWYAFAIFMPYGKLSDTLSILVENRNWIWIYVWQIPGIPPLFGSDADERWINLDRIGDA
jgi:hypothetical protein